MGYVRDVTKEVSVEERRESCVLHYTLPADGRAPLEVHAEIAYEHLPDVIRALSETAGRKIKDETGKPDLKALDKDVIAQGVQRQVVRLREAQEATLTNIREIGKLLGIDLGLF